MWSLGSILLEMLTGFPLWLSLKSRVSTSEGWSVINHGLFGVAGRDNSKILAKQQSLFGSDPQQLLSFLRKNYYLSDQRWSKNPAFMSLLWQTLSFHP
jgi:dual specificity tyrosine-phosphorylation-regulated kinase 2/3/4